MNKRLPKIIYAKWEYDRTDAFLNAEETKEKHAIVGDTVEVGVYTLTSKAKVRTTVDLIAVRKSKVQIKLYAKETK